MICVYSFLPSSHPQSVVYICTTLLGGVCACNVWRLCVCSVVSMFSMQVV